MTAKSKRRRARQRSARRHRALIPPGSLVAAPDALPSVIHVIAYGPDRHTERTIRDLSEIDEFVGRWPVTWINVDGLGDIELIQALGERFGLHPLALADVVHTTQRPKVEVFRDHQFIVVRMVESADPLDIEQVSLFLGRDWVLTFQEDQGDCLDVIRARIRTGAGRIRARGSDHLAYSLLDAIIDNYFPILEACGESLERIEGLILTSPREGRAGHLHQIRRDLLMIRHAVWPMRDLVSTLLRDESPLISEETRTHLRDCHDHIVQLIDLDETQRELAAGLMDLHLANVSARMNEVIKLLTIIATVFMPLTFIAGLFGMNFVLPGMAWAGSFWATLLLMAVIGAGMLWLFWRKGWMRTAIRDVSGDAKPDSAEDKP